MPARAKSTRMPTTLPLLIRSSITGGFNATMSAGAPLSTVAITLAAKTALTSSGRDLECSCQIPHPRDHPHAAHDRDLGRGRGALAQHSQHGESGRRQYVHPSRHDILPIFLSHAVCALLCQGLAGSTKVLRSRGAASGEIMNLIIARAASGSLEPVIRATLEGQGTFRKPGRGPTYSVPGAPTMM